MKINVLLCAKKILTGVIPNKPFLFRVFTAHKKNPVKCYFYINYCFP